MNDQDGVDNGPDQTLRLLSDQLKITDPYRDFFENANDAFFLVDAFQNYVDANRKAVELLGCSRAELLTKSIFDFIPDVQKPRSREEFDRLKQRGSYEKFRGKVETVDGRQLDVEVSSSAIMDGDTYLGSRDIVRDITDLVQVEQSLRNSEARVRKSEQFIRTILDTVDEGYIVVDRDYRIICANQAYGRQANMFAGNMAGRYCYEVSHGADRPCYEQGEECPVLHAFSTGKPHIAVHRHRDPQGNLLYVETKAYPLKDDAGSVMSVIETVNNITERHLLEEERLKTQKLEAIGTLAGGIAHDFNNLLQGVFGYISMAKMLISEKERSLAMLCEAEQALHQSVNLTKQLLTFSKGGRPVKKTIAVRPMMEDAVKFALSGSRADYRIEVDEDLRMIEADEGQIGQVIQNIVINAEQAMPVGGTVLITARNGPEPGKPGVRTFVEISVQDTGIGISPQYLPRIFDPYFTTKKKGSGLGLATAYSIVRGHGGIIEATSEVDKGTTVSVYLPAVEPEPGIPDAPAVLTEKKGRVLVMDDEELVRKIAGEMITAGGHEVECADHGEAAIEKYLDARTSGRPFDIVILDLTVRGGLGGQETLENLLKLDPSVRAIVSSGYSGDAVVSDFSSYGFAGRLTKPYDFNELMKTLNAVLSLNNHTK